MTKRTTDRITVFSEIGITAIISNRLPDLMRSRADQIRFLITTIRQTAHCTCFRFAQLLVHPGALSGVFGEMPNLDLAEKEKTARILL